MSELSELIKINKNIEKQNEEIIRTFICLVATYILNRINDVNQS